MESTTKEFKLIRVLQKLGKNGFYSVDHPSGSYVLDPEGRLRSFAKGADTADVIAQDLKTPLEA